MKPPSLSALLCGLVPFAGIAFSVAWWDRLSPHVLGLPFNFFWLLLWSFLTPMALLAAACFEKKR